MLAGEPTEGLFGCPACHVLNTPAWLPPQVGAVYEFNASPDPSGHAAQYVPAIILRKAEVGAVGGGGQAAQRERRCTADRLLERMAARAQQAAAAAEPRRGDAEVELLLAFPGEACLAGDAWFRRIDRACSACLEPPSASASALACHQPLGPIPHPHNHTGCKHPWTVLVSDQELAQRSSPLRASCGWSAASGEWREHADPLAAWAEMGLSGARSGSARPLLCCPALPMDTSTCMQTHATCPERASPLLPPAPVQRTFWRWCGTLPRGTTAARTSAPPRMCGASWRRPPAATAPACCSPCSAASGSAAWRATRCAPGRARLWSCS